MKYFAFTVFLFSFSIAVFAQQPAGTPPPSPPAEQDAGVVKISTTLIQLDVVVTDRKGRQVTDLKPEDFEVYENGERQPITNFSYISTNPRAAADVVSAAARAAGPQTKGRLPVPLPPAKLKLEQVRRTYAVVVDDLGISFGNIPAVKDALKKLINEQMREGDLVAIVRTGSGMGALQSFTNDKRLLLAAIDKIKWNPHGRGGIGNFAPITTDAKEDIKGWVRADGTVINPAGIEEDKEFREQIDAFRGEIFSVGSLGALNYVIRGMRELPGRKSLMLFSEGFRLGSYTGGLRASAGASYQSTRIFEQLKLLADLANRSSVVIYTLDPRGLVNTSMFSAEDDVRDVFSSSVTDREMAFRTSQHTLGYIARETGGFPFMNQNKLETGVERVMDDQKGFYLIGYEPDADTFDPKKNRYNKLSVKVKRPGVEVRYRSGFFGIADERIAQIKQTKQQQIFSALTSPFGASGINLNLYTISGSDRESGYFIRSFVHIPGEDLHFAEQPDGTRVANFDVVAMTFGDNGVPIDQVTKNYTLRVRDKAYRGILERGFVYKLFVPVKKPGAYQFRIALRDSTGERVGSASQFIEVPAIRKNLSLSKIVLSGYSPEELQRVSAGQKTVAAEDGGNNGGGEEAAFINTILRKFRRGTAVRYDAIVYNAKPESVQKSQLRIQVRLFRDRSPVMESEPSVLDTRGQTDPQRLETSGTITLGKNLPPGEYLLQLVVSDNPPQKKPRVATQFIEFEVVE